jgi:hypothetical protein
MTRARAGRNPYEHTRQKRKAQGFLRTDTRRTTPAGDREPNYQFTPAFKKVGYGMNDDVLLPSDDFRPQTPGIVQKGSSGSIRSAVDHVRGVLCPGETVHGNDWGDPAGDQWRALKAYCHEEGLVLSRPIDLIKGGREHDFCHRDDRVWKATKPSSAGYTVSIDDASVMILPASPLEYLNRWSITNRIFGDDAEFLVVVDSPSGSRIVVSQRIAVGEYASWEEIDSYLVQIKGFERINPPGLDSCGGPESRAYVCGRFAVFDVRPPNCVLSQSRVIPIDVIPIVLSRGASDYLSRWIVEAAGPGYAERLLVATRDHQKILSSRSTLIQMLSQRGMGLSPHYPQQDITCDLGRES